MLNRIHNVLTKGARFLFVKILEPRETGEDDRRREYILNILLASSILMLVLLDYSVLYHSIVLGPNYQGISFGAFSAIVAVFVMFLVLSRSGHFVPAAYLFIATYFLSISYAAFQWGVDLPTVLLGYAILIVAASILIGTRFSFLVVALIALWTIPVWIAQVKGIIEPQWYWKHSPPLTNGLVFALMFLVITVISWLSNREIERSLIRARKSEAELKNERDLLEVRVEERTAELKRLQLERSGELARFAEFGRQAQGIVHDLLNPLSAVALNIEELSRHNAEMPSETGDYLRSAIEASRRMDKSLTAIRKHMSHKEAMVSFSLAEEVEQVLRLFEYSARKSGIVLSFRADEAVQVYGDPIKFHHIVSSLVSNAVDAYDAVPSDSGRRREVRIRLRKERDIVRFTVEDFGSGIPQEYLQKIFDPFFTTKDIRKGTGLGLAMAKNLVEQAFGGRIHVVSAVGEGSAFTVEFAV